MSISGKPQQFVMACHAERVTPVHDCAGSIAALSMMRTQWQSWWAWLVRCRPFMRTLLTWGSLLPRKPPLPSARLSHPFAQAVMALQVRLV